MKEDEKEELRRKRSGQIRRRVKNFYGGLEVGNEEKGWAEE